MKRTWRWLLRLGALFGLMLFAGFLVAASGLIPIRASSGHWAITEWMLQFGKRRSLATHTIGVELPPLDAPWLVAKGAGQYDIACRPCHGSPGHEHPRIAAAMLPPPPYLPPLIGEREPEELFYVVKHGLKFTGMPAWPTQQRDDEVHAMVAFLLAFPTDAGGYRRLVSGDPPVETPRELAADVSGSLANVIASCDRCHGIDGRGRSPAFPRLAGQRREYLLRALAAYARDRRHSGIMGPIAAASTSDDHRALAEHYSSIPSAPLGGAPRGASERGRAIAHEGIASQGVPSCVDCHGPGTHDRNPAYPNIAGQYSEYIVLQLELFKRGQRGGSEYGHVMQRIAARLTAEQMRDVAAYYGSE